MFEIVSTVDVRLGMWVADLDRPWLDTPFLLQGFLVEDETQIAQLRSLCRFVTIDRTRSIGDEYRPGEVFVPEKRSHSVTLAEAIPYESRRKLKLPPLAISAVRTLGRHNFRTVEYPETIRVEDELPSAEENLANAQRLLDDITQELSSGKVPDVDRVEETVDGLVECVVRNADALLWMSKLKRTDNETYDHAITVSIHLMAFGRTLGIPPDDLHHLGMGGLLKDVGFIQLPSALVHKPAGLTPDERRQMHDHVQLSCDMLAGDFAVSGEVQDIIAKHHERIDGSGYPARLRGEEIGLYPEMAGIVDSYCAMSYPRAFRPARNPQWVTDEINSMRDVSFSASVIDEFIRFIGLYPVGTLVELNSGEVAVVFEQNRVRRMKPRVMVLLGPDKTRNHSPGILNLLNDPQISDGVPYRIVRVLPSGAFGLDPKEFYL